MKALSCYFALVFPGVSMKTCQVIGRIKRARQTNLRSLNFFLLNYEFIYDLFSQISEIQQNWGLFLLKTRNYHFLS